MDEDHRSSLKGVEWIIWISRSLSFDESVKENVLWKNWDVRYARIRQAKKMRPIIEVDKAVEKYFGFLACCRGIDVNKRNVTTHIYTACYRLSDLATILAAVFIFFLF